MLFFVVRNLVNRLSSVEVRYRREGGEFVDTTMDLVRIDALAGSVPAREFR
jgi:hypothetical protein